MQKAVLHKLKITQQQAELITIHNDLFLRDLRHVTGKGIIRKKEKKDTKNSSERRVKEKSIANEARRLLLHRAWSAMSGKKRLSTTKQRVAANRIGPPGPTESRIGLRYATF